MNHSVGPFFCNIKRTFPFSEAYKPLKGNWLVFKILLLLLQKVLRYLFFFHTKVSKKVVSFYLSIILIQINFQSFIYAKKIPPFRNRQKFSSKQREDERVQTLRVSNSKLTHCLPRSSDRTLFQFFFQISQKFHIIIALPHLKSKISASLFIFCKPKTTISVNQTLKPVLKFFWMSHVKSLMRRLLTAIVFPGGFSFLYSRRFYWLFQA